MLASFSSRALLVVCLALTSCAGAAKSASFAVAAAPEAAAAAPAPLDRSLFSKNPDGSLGEDELQQILDAPIELDLPARVGVLPIVSAQDWRGPGPDHGVPSGAGEFVSKLRASEDFSLVTEVLPIPSGALGMEALREMAARYRLRYIVLYRESFTRKTRSNGWAFGYATVVGALFLPGENLQVEGTLEASLFDVKTGLLLFTVRRGVSASRDSSVWHKGDKLARMESSLSRRYAADLARDVFSATDQLIAAVALEARRRTPAPDAAAPAAALTP